MITSPGLQQTSSDIFWGEIAPCEHLVQIYDHDDVFLDSLEGFVAGGIRNNDGVIVIATGAHLLALEDRLITRGCDFIGARSRDQYIAVEAEEALSRFMIEGWPNDELFRLFVTELLMRGRGNGRQVRAFGEMVALLWAQGHNGATVRLEHLWHMFCRQEAFCLFCAYPKTGFTQDASASIREICETHTKIVAGSRAA